MNEAGFVERRLKREERKWVSSCVPAAGRAFPPPVDGTAGQPQEGHSRAMMTNGRGRRMGDTG